MVYGGVLVGLLFEGRADGGWIQAGPQLEAGDPPGSVSHNAPDGLGRDVIVFECSGPYSTIRRSLVGIDKLVDGGVGRMITSAGMELLARLLPGEQYEMQLRLDNGMSMTGRWTHVEDR